MLWNILGFRVEVVMEVAEGSVPQAAVEAMVPQAVVEALDLVEEDTVLRLAVVLVEDLLLLK